MINDNSEELRYKFVDFANKKTLTFTKNKLSDEVNKEKWEEFFDKYVKKNKRENKR